MILNCHVAFNLLCDTDCRKSLLAGKEETISYKNVAIEKNYKNTTGIYLIGQSERKRGNFWNQ